MRSVVNIEEKIGKTVRKRRPGDPLVVPAGDDSAAPLTLREPWEASLLDLLGDEHAREMEVETVRFSEKPRGAD